MQVFQAFLSVQVVRHFDRLCIREVNYLMLALLSAWLDNLYPSLFEHTDLFVHVVVDREALINVESRCYSCLNCRQTALIAH